MSATPATSFTARAPACRIAATLRLPVRRQPEGRVVRHENALALRETAWIGEQAASVLDVHGRAGGVGLVEEPPVLVRRAAEVAALGERAPGDDHGTRIEREERRRRDRPLGEVHAELDRVGGRRNQRGQASGVLRVLRRERRDVRRDRQHSVRQNQKPPSLSGRGFPSSRWIMPRPMVVGRARLRPTGFPPATTSSTGPNASWRSDHPAPGGDCQGRRRGGGCGLRIPTSERQREHRPVRRDVALKPELDTGRGRFIEVGGRRAHR